MKILHLCQLYHPSLGGNQIHIQLLSEKLAGLGDEAHVFTANAREPVQFAVEDRTFVPLPDRETVNGVHIGRFKICYRLRDLMFKKLSRVRGGYKGVHLLLGDAYDYWQTGPLVPQMLLAIRRMKPDLVVAVMNYSFTTYVGYLAKKLFGFKLAVMPIVHPSDPRMSHPFLKKIYGAADGIIACTEFEKKHLLAQGVPEQRIETRPLGVELDSFQGQDGEKVRQKYNIGRAPVIAYLGRKVMNKGIESLIEAMKAVWRDFPDAKLLLAGETRASFMPVLEECLGRLTLEERRNVIRTEKFSEEDKKDFFAALDVFVMTSGIDCFGIVYLEAWLSGKPVIACKNTAQESFIDDGVNGLLVNYNDAGQLAGAIKSLLRDRDFRERMGQAGLNKVKGKHDLNDYAINLQRYYHRLVEEKR